MTQVNEPVDAVEETTEVLDDEDTGTMGVNDYRVRIVFKIPSVNPRDAVEQMIEQLVDHGLRNWTYHVEDLETNEQFYVDGYGKITTMEDFMASLVEDGLITQEDADAAEDDDDDDD